MVCEVHKSFYNQELALRGETFSTFEHHKLSFLTSVNQFGQNGDMTLVTHATT